MNKELMEALDVLEKEKNISKDTLLGAIEQSLIQACKNHFGKADNVHVTINPNTCDFSVYAERTVVEYVEDPALEISLVDAQKINANAEIEDVIKVEIHSKEFGRIATQNAKNVILQKIREEERKVLYDQYYGQEKEVVTGIVQRVMGRNVSVNLGKADAILSENEQVRVSPSLEEIRSTSFSPCTVGIEETRMSYSCRSTITVIRPSWGLRFSEISMPPIILMRVEMAGRRLLSYIIFSKRAPSMR